MAKKWVRGHEVEPFHEEEWEWATPATVERTVKGVMIKERPKEKTFRAWMKENYGRRQLLKGIVGDPSGWLAGYAEDRELLYEVYRGEMWNMIAQAAEAAEESLPELIHRASEELRYYVSDFHELVSLVVWISASITAQHLLSDPNIKW